MPLQINGRSSETGLQLQAVHDYATADAMRLIHPDPWRATIRHHPKSERLLQFMRLYDDRNCSNYFDWKVGGDGDNGEMLMYQMDAFFELMDRLEGQDAPDACA